MFKQPRETDAQFREMAGLLIGKLVGPRRFTDCTTMPVQAGGMRFVRVKLCATDLPDDTIGLWHSHRVSTRPSLRDVIAYIRVAAILRRPLIFVVVSFMRAEASAIELSIWPPRVRRLRFGSIDGADAVIRIAIKASSSST